MRIFSFFLLFAVCTWLASPAMARTELANTYVDYDQTQPIQGYAASSASYEKSWTGTLGVGVMSMPEYLGANDNEMRVLPMVDLEYRQRYFLSSRRGLGFYVFRDNRFALATMVNMDWGRDESDNARLRGLGDLDPTPQLGFDLKWSANKWLSFNADAYQAIAPGGHEGLHGSVGAGARWPLMRQLALRADTGIRWASDSYMDNVFGVNAVQSARSGLARFNSGSGVMAWQFGMSLDYNLTEHWFISPTARYVGLLNDAADSPITQDDGQYYAGLFMGYRF